MVWERGEGVGGTRTQHPSPGSSRKPGPRGAAKGSGSPAVAAEEGNGRSRAREDRVRAGNPPGRGEAGEPGRGGPRRRPELGPRARAGAAAGGGSVRSGLCVRDPGFAVVDQVLYIMNKAGMFLFLLGKYLEENMLGNSIMSNSQDMETTRVH
nr:translation initiation factor IF-2-like [Equus asinus]